jgi:hypothetical protein
MNEKHSCYDLHQIFTVKEKRPFSVALHIKPAFKTVDKFEDWCRTQTFRNTNQKMTFYSACNLPYRSKQKILLHIFTLLKEHQIDIDADAKKFLQHNKQSLCILDKEASFILSLIDLFVNYLQKNNLSLYLQKKEYKRLADVGNDLLTTIQEMFPNAFVENNAYSNFFTTMVNEDKETCENFRSYVKQLVRNYISIFLSQPYMKESLLTNMQNRAVYGNFRTLLLNVRLT